jgi:hypothetical protein
MCWLLRLENLVLNLFYRAKFVFKSHYINSDAGVDKQLLDATEQTISATAIFQRQ